MWLLNVSIEFFLVNVHINENESCYWFSIISSNYCVELKINSHCCCFSIFVLPYSDHEVSLGFYLLEASKSEILTNGRSLFHFGSYSTNQARKNYSVGSPKKLWILFKIRATCGLHKDPWQIISFGNCLDKPRPFCNVFRCLENVWFIFKKGKFQVSKST